MSTSYNHHFDLEAFVTGDVDAAQRRDVEEHLATCAECREEVESLREMEKFLGELPPEALLDGPPDDADLLLQRTLRQVRSESSNARGRGRLLTSAAAVMVAAAALGAGVWIGGSGDDSGSHLAAPPPPAPTTEATGIRFASGTNSATGARITFRMTPAVGWTQVNASVSGIPAGEKCRLVVIGKDGSREVAGGWVVSNKGEKDGVNLDGSAPIDPENVSSVLVENTEGHEFVSAAL
ncbi:zf-HC2 domain-containing protein [Saccharopolyspora sp. K220]|uniref:anti-sigma factor family protein n=1 Tax=Saccharopolyspora soli TaxID=2926618 RepID=UPI001F5960E7|nr:zf-HC2 domain-containing protein [Saccharopolyspora soli]MCI2416903.1 zf-HC2 domain-containing protein [Saccharopolyspora soli]